MKVNRRSDQTTTAGLLRGRVSDIREDGLIAVVPDGESDIHLLCEILQTGESSICEINLDDQVVLMAPTAGSSLGCIIGKPGRQHNPDQATDQIFRIHKKEIQISADTSIALKCGEGSLTIAADGTIIIRGARILSRAKGTNKVKGAAVQIN